MKTAAYILSAALACARATAAQSQSTTTGGSSVHLTTATVPQASGLPSPPPQTGCPTVTSTRAVCSTCVVPACIQLATVTQFCGCPTPVPTVYLDFPCSGGCEGLFCQTAYSILPAGGLETCASSGAASSPSSTVTSTTVTPGSSSSFPGPSLSFPPNGTASTVTTRPPVTPPTTRPTQSGPPINAAGRPRPFRFWL